MKKFIVLYKEKWYVPVIVIIILGIIGMDTISIHSEIVFYLSLALPLLSIVASGVIGLIRIFKKDYYKGILQLGITGFTGFVGLYFLSFYLTFYPYDFYASNLTIPQNIIVNEPIDEEDSESDNTATVNDLDFELYKSFQSGIYRFEFMYKAPSKGYIYLKAFEITKNEALSRGRLEDRSKILIDTLTDLPMRYTAPDSFTIYEGDWGDEYAARFEVWYKAVNNPNEIKLTEKVYKIQGWQR